MTSLFKKLNFKNQTSILVINPPSSFEIELSAMQNITQITRDLKSVTKIDFAICFVTNVAEIENIVPLINRKIKDDAILWMCYPKASSKKYKCDFNRDTGWVSLGEINLEPVRMVAIDEDWSALRFRKVEFIKTITRRESFALTKEAKERTNQKNIRK